MYIPLSILIADKMKLHDLCKFLPLHQHLYFVLKRLILNMQLLNLLHLLLLNRMQPCFAYFYFSPFLKTTDTHELLFHRQSQRPHSVVYCNNYKKSKYLRYLTM